MTYNVFSGTLNPTHSRLGTFHFRILQNSNFSDVTDFYSDHNFRIVTQHEEQG